MPARWTRRWTGQEPRPGPICLHFAVNRPVGCVRGESDLAPVLVWLRRYARWLEDRTMLNAAVRAFLWVVRVPGTMVEQKKLQYARPPDYGTVMVVDKEQEEWQAVAPDLHANDAQADGRAIRWMIVAGGPGVGLVDMGEGEEANLATAKAMGEQRSRFMRARQQYFAWALATTALTAYNRAVRLGKGVSWANGPGQVRTLADIRIGVPDISPADNAELGTSAAQVAAALASVGQQGIGGKTWRRLVVRTVLKFAGETVGEEELGRHIGGVGTRPGGGWRAGGGTWGRGAWRRGHPRMIEYGTNERMAIANGHPDHRSQIVIRDRESAIWMSTRPASQFVHSFYIRSFADGRGPRITGFGGGCVWGCRWLGRLELAGGGEQVIAEGPVLLTSVAVAEMTGTAPAAVAVMDKDAGLVVLLCVLAGDCVVWSPCEPVAVSGLKIASQLGDVTVSYSYR